jgi:Tetratricopeptide repeat/Cytochrome c554 and c-prime
MEHTPEPGPAEALPKRIWRAIPVVALLAIATVLGVWSVWPRGGRKPRADAAAPLNARAGVRYVGDAACTRCHEEIAKAYRQHPMGRSILPIKEAPAEVRGGPTERTLFSDQGFDYSLLNQGGRTIHRETRRDRTGKVIGQVEGEVRYVLGSGSHARAFLIERDDYLFQSPITWYSQEDRWGLAPSYEKRVGRFERQVSPACLTCHANQVEHVEGTEGRYRPPTFRGHSVGCERCHGPGELHLAEPTLSPGEPPRIVNPAHLAPALREAVCQQCHLLGVSEIVRYGRELADYRPGLPLHDFVTVFVRSLPKQNDHPNADHVEQLHQSQCFRQSQGALGCISCHDPHELPPAGTKVAYYRERCLTCHRDKGCALPRLVRLEVSPEDSCIECHMPRAGTSNVAHLATTHHGIVRRRQSAFQRSAPPSDPPPGQPSLVPFHRELMSEAELRATSRDLGVALRGEGPRYAAEALPLLQQAHKDHPDDILAWESMGFALWGLGRKAEALGVFESVLKQSPNRESTLVSAAQLAGALDQVDRAVALWRRSIAVDPWRSDYHADLAEQLVRLEDWPAAIAAASQALKLSPANRTARIALIAATFRSGFPDKARALLDTLLAFDPPDREELVRWYEKLR